jgi:hypothetical protein
MLSKTEREFLQGKLKVSKNYENKLLFSIRTKLRCYLDTDLQLLQLGFVRGLPLLGKLTSYHTKLIPPFKIEYIPSINNNDILKFCKCIDKNIII